MEKSMWHKLLILISLIIFSGCTTKMTEGLSSESQEDMVFPEWFWHPPRLRSGGVAVGYSPSYYYPKEAVEAAELNGIETLAKQMSVRIKGGKAYMKDDRGIHFAGEKIEELLSNRDWSHPIGHKQYRISGQDRKSNRDWSRPKGTILGGRFFSPI